MEAVVLAGGQGSRLLPVTAELPKPLVPVGGKPVIEFLLRQLRQGGVKRVCLAVNHLAHLIEEAIGDGSRFGLEVVYSREEEPLSTVGPIKLINDLPETFIVANGDILTDLNIESLFENHVESGAELTVATYRRDEQVDYGVLEAGSDNAVTGFSEKPTYSFHVSMGIYVFSRSVLDLVPEGKPFGFDELVLALLAAKRKVMSFPYQGYWLDIGRPADYAQAQQDIERIQHLSGE